MKKEDPRHPILSRSWEYQIIGLNLQREPAEENEPFLDLTLRRGDEYRTLRFWSPQDLEIERGGPCMTGGLVILDVLARNLDKLGVRVDDFEASHGQVRFWARAVEERKV